MKNRTHVIFILLFAFFFAFFVYEAREWRLQARLYPYAIGIPMLVLAVIYAFLELRGKSKAAPSSEGGAPADFRFTQTQDPALARARTINIFSWIFAFFAAVWLFGFSFSVAALLFLYLKFQGREGWVLSIALTAAGWLCFWALFVRLLNLPFPDGQLLLWLGLGD
jgi:Tripartite tricarboxylate transporter TctB family